MADSEIWHHVFWVSQTSPESQLIYDGNYGHFYHWYTAFMCHSCTSHSPQPIWEWPWNKRRFRATVLWSVLMLQSVKYDWLLNFMENFAHETGLEDIWCMGANLWQTGNISCEGTISHVAERPSPSWMPEAYFPPQSDFWGAFFFSYDKGIVEGRF